MYPTHRYMAYINHMGSVPSFLFLGETYGLFECLVWYRVLGLGCFEVRIFPCFVGGETQKASEINPTTITVTYLDSVSLDDYVLDFAFFYVLVCTFVEGKIVHAAYRTQPPTHPTVAEWIHRFQASHDGTHRNHSWVGQPSGFFGVWWYC